jgi:hypothetical protein
MSSFNPVPKPKKAAHNKNSRHKSNPAPTHYEPCEVPGCPNAWRETHEVFHGTGNRNMSIRYRMQAKLCLNHHKGREGVHSGNVELDLFLKQKYQRIFESQYGHDAFMKAIKRNYL